MPDQDSAPDELKAPTMWAATGFDQPSAARSKVGRRPSVGMRSPFDVCHVGVVLRVAMGVLVVVALAASHEATGPQSWLMRSLNAWTAALPAALLWLVLTCSLRPVFDRLRLAAQWILGVLLGMLAGLYGQAQSSMIDWWLGGRVLHWWDWVPCLLSGGAMAVLTMGWLRLRWRSEMPAQTQARLAELQARIRPHFLFNTLNTAIALVQIEPQRAEAVLEDLAELFRQALTSPHARVRLADEIDLARRYLSIEQLRFGSRLTVHWALDDAAGEAEVPALILQPLVENAVKHGIESDPKGGWLRVSTLVKGGQAVVTISNSVPNLPVGATAGHGIALRNVKQRLQLMHDLDASFSAGLQRSADGGQSAVYVVRLTVPLKSAGSLL